MSTALASPLLLGTCLFGTADGHTVIGHGCLANASDHLERSLEMRQYRIGPIEDVWFSFPVTVEGHPARLIGLVSFARDFKNRDGTAGAAVVVSEEETIRPVGFSGTMLIVEDLHKRLFSTCVATGTRQLSLARAEEVLRHHPVSYAESQLFIAADPISLRLPEAWPLAASLPELFRALRQHPARFSQEYTRGFVLRTAPDAECDREFPVDFLVNWHDELYGEMQRKIDEAAKQYSICYAAWQSEAKAHKEAIESRDDERTRRERLDKDIGQLRDKLRADEQTSSQLRSTAEQAIKEVARLKQVEKDLNGKLGGLETKLSDKTAEIERLTTANPVIQELQQQVSGYEKSLEQWKSSCAAWQKAHATLDQQIKAMNAAAPQAGEPNGAPAGAGNVQHGSFREPAAPQADPYHHMPASQVPIFPPGSEAYQNNQNGARSGSITAAIPAALGLMFLVLVGVGWMMAGGAGTQWGWQGANFAPSSAPQRPASSGTNASPSERERRLAEAVAKAEAEKRDADRRASDMEKSLERVRIDIERKANEQQAQIAQLIRDRQQLEALVKTGANVVAPPPPPPPPERRPPPLVVSPAVSDLQQFGCELPPELKMSARDYFQQIRDACYKAVTAATNPMCKDRNLYNSAIDALNSCKKPQKCSSKINIINGQITANIKKTEEVINKLKCMGVN